MFTPCHWLIFRQLLEERAQEIEEFFKSESEDDENLSCSSPISELFEGSKKISSTEELLSNDEVSSSNNVPSQQEPNTSHFSINESLSDNDKSSSSNYPIKEDICNRENKLLPKFNLFLFFISTSIGMQRKRFLLTFGWESARE